MTDGMTQTLPDLFVDLAELSCLYETEIVRTCDGFCAASVPVAELLARRGIATVLDSKGALLACRLYFDDWYLFSVSDGADTTYGLFKMREQEYDAKLGRTADGDMPGVTVSFIALQETVLLDCLREPTSEHGAQLNREINRVVAFAGQRHSEALRRYFLRTESKGAYLIAKLYTARIASLAQGGCLPVPERYARDYEKWGTGGRVARFIEENNRDAGKVVCDHKKICIGDPLHPTKQERLAILATHAGNTSLFSFAAEVQFHARFLTWWAKLPIPVIGRSPYASAIRADMSIGDAEFAGPTPYYRSNSSIVKNQYRCHTDEV